MCSALANNASAWDQLVRCTSCGSPNSVVWGYPPSNVQDQQDPCYGIYTPGHSFPAVEIGSLTIGQVSCDTIPNHTDTWQV